MAEENTNPTPIPAEDNPIVKKQEYTVRVTTTKDGKSSMHRINDGFACLELLGMLTMCQNQIIAQIEGKMPLPDVIKRDVIKD